ncbi:MAG: isoprenylcysteine carboxylmethyltransferase family protein [Gammaproteobacteria bacterium]|nr:isoprenylcysteine carboxylmethyltransferase family protein [Gammaproteobacteria bacterium]
MKSLELKIPPVAVFLLCGTGMWLLESLLPELGLSLPADRLVAVFVACVGLAVAVAGVLAFRSAKTTVDPRYPEKSSSVVTRGIYRKSRNPMYLGLLLVLLGWAIFLRHVLPFAVLPVFVLYMNRFQIIPEERVMQASFGDEYSAYQNEVGRWI